MPYNLSIFSFPFSPLSARYYNSDLSIWLSVASPYAYCVNNPVRLVC